MRAGAVSAAAFPSGEMRKYALVMVLVGLARFTVTTDFSVMTLVLPLISKGLGISPIALSWIVAVEGIFYAGFLILGGRMTDIVGQRRCLLAGLIIFGVGSALSGLAPSFWALIGARAVQGLGAALLAPSSFSLLTTLIPDGPIRHRALAVFGIMQGMSVIVGLIIGGLLANQLGWRAVFALNVPLVALAVSLTLFVVPKGARTERPGRLDWAGAVLITGATALLLSSLSMLGRYGWSSPWAWGLGIVAVIALAVFLAVEARASDPLVPLSILGQRSMISGGVGGLFLIAAVGSLFVLSNLYMQRELGFQPLYSGLGMTAYAIAAVLVGFAVPTIMARLRMTTMLAGSFCVLTAGLILLTFAGPNASYFALLAPALVLCGAGVTIAWTALMAHATQSIPPHAQGAASGCLFTFQQIGSPLGAATALITVAPAGGLEGPSRVHALHSGFLVAVGFGVAGLVVSVLLGERRRSAVAG